MKLKLAQIATMCNGKLSSRSDPDLVLTECVIDSRLVTNHSLFIAIKGENTDAHDFIVELVKSFNQNLDQNKNCLAQKAGSIACIISSPELMHLPNCIFVDDTTKALGILAQNYRKMLTLPMVAITGSNGKTSVKEMLKYVCKQTFGDDYVIATEGNLNNHWGLPLTMLRIKPKHRVAILEMGMNHLGELNYLSNLAKPTIAVVNNVCWAHVGFFTGLEQVAQAKGEIYDGVIDGGVACVNMADRFGAYWLEKIKQLPQYVKLYCYGDKNSGLYIRAKDGTGKFEFMTPIGAVSGQLNVLGEHNVSNALTVTALALNLGCKLSDIRLGLSAYRGYARRLEKKSAFNGAIIIDDSYNANPDSTKAAILAIKAFQAPRWMVFGDMGELGQWTEEKHTEIGRFAYEHGIDHLITVGEYSKNAAESFLSCLNSNNLNASHTSKLITDCYSHKLSDPSKLDKSNVIPMACYFTKNEQVIQYCKLNLPSDAVILVKGSKYTKVSEVVNSLL